MKLHTGKFFFLFYTFILLCESVGLKAQTGINTKNPHASAAIDITSSNKGLLLPRIALTSNTDATTIPGPTAGLMVWSSGTAGLAAGVYTWNGSQWVSNTATGGGGTGTGWSLNGNNTAATDFLGTTNWQNLNFKVNNIPVGLLHPNGGINFGIGSSANANNSIAIGTSAIASASTESMAIGHGALASAYQSTAIGHSARASNNNAAAVGFQANASGQYSTTLGYAATASGQSSTAIGYQASTSQANAIVLGNSTNTNNKVGIGTSTPDERLHIAGKVKIVDGTQASGYILTSDANGVASWTTPATATNIAYAQILKNGDALLQNTTISFGNNGPARNLSQQNDYIQTQTKKGIYRVTYTIAVRKESGSSATVNFFLTVNGNEIQGSRCSAAFINGNGNGNNSQNIETITITRLINIQTEYQLIRLQAEAANSDILILANGTSLLVEFVE